MSVTGRWFAYSPPPQKCYEYMGSLATQVLATGMMMAGGRTLNIVLCHWLHILGRNYIITVLGHKRRNWTGLVFNVFRSLVGAARTLGQWSRERRWRKCVRATSGGVRATSDNPGKKDLQPDPMFNHVYLEKIPLDFMSLTSKYKHS